MMRDDATRRSGPPPVSGQSAVAAARPFEFPPLAEVRQNLRVKWYRSPIDPGTLRRLMQRSDLQGALQALGHLGLFAATGALTAYFFTRTMWLPFALTLWCHGTFGTFMYIAGHDLGHGTVFRTKWLNRLFQSIFGVLSFWNPHEHDLSHIYHHRYTLYPDGDRELPGQYYGSGVVVHPWLLNIRPWRVIQLLTFSFASLRHLTMSTLRLATRRYRMKFTGIFASEWASALFATSPESERKAVRFARITIAFHVAGLVIGAVLGAWWLPIVLTGSVGVGRWLFELIVMPQHFGLMDSVPDFRMTTRSIKLNPFTSFLYWRMNWHAEHHMYAGVPCYNLKKLAREIAPDMPRLRTLWQAWAEMIESARRQRQDPNYQYQTPLPPTAHPAVLREDEVVLPEGERLAAEASIGDLAHQR
jgi:fatty acid desaturase